MIPGQDHLSFQFKNFPQDFPPTCKDKPLLEADSVTGEMMDFYLSSNNRLSPGYKFCMPSLKWLALRTLVYTILWEVLSCMERGGGALLQTGFVGYSIVQQFPPIAMLFCMLFSHLGVFH